jgi:hypothetical protein
MPQMDQEQQVRSFSDVVMRQHFEVVGLLGFEPRTKRL